MQKKEAGQSFTPFPNSPPDYSSPKISTLNVPGNSLKIISWNIWMLPRFILRTSQSQRAYEIVKVLKHEEADIIVFQEAFDAKAREIIRKGLLSEFPFESGNPPKNIAWKTNSGLWILSKLPFNVIKHLYFEVGQGPDWFACKGAMLIQSEKNGFAFQLIGTHLQSDFAGIHSHKTRRIQCEQIRKELIEPFSEQGMPQFLAGDFNTIRHESENYEEIRSILRAEEFSLHGEHSYSYDHTANDLIKGERDKPQLIDYIFYTGNGHHMPDARMFINVFKKQWHQKFHDLSDHFAIGGIFQFSK
jgi:endonuclease/exonuclease/phosphatase family metal-dependent hydrolase